MHRRAALIAAIAVASALSGGTVPQGVRRNIAAHAGLCVAVSDGIQRAEVDALIAAARDCVGVSYTSTRIDNARRCACFEALDDIGPLIEYWDEIGGAPLLMLADDRRWDDSCNVTARAAAAVDRFAAQHALLKPLPTRPTAAKRTVVAENLAIDGSYVDHGGERWFDTSRVVAVDGLVDEALSVALLQAMRGRSENVDKRSWRRGALRDVVDGDSVSSAGACWGLSAARLKSLYASDAVLELQSRLVTYLEQYNDEVLVSALPEAALGDAVGPLAANAPVHGDEYGWHIDADPMLLPPGPFTDFFGRSPNRAPGCPRFVSALVYPAPEWRPDWGAPTEFLDPPTGDTIAIAPRPSRVVFLDQDVSHRVCAPTAAAGSRPRYSLVLKLVLHAPGTVARFAPDPPATIVGSALS